MAPPLLHAVDFLGRAAVTRAAKSSVEPAKACVNSPGPRQSDDWASHLLGRCSHDPRL